MNESEKKEFKIDYTPFIFQEHLEPIGRLPREHALAASAAWYFCRCAHQSIESLQTQVTYEGDTDVTVSLRGLANNIRVQYGLKDLEEMMRFAPACKEEATRLGLHWSPVLDTWLQSGGKKMDEVTREPDKLNLS